MSIKERKMHAIYKAVPMEDIQRIIDYCRDHMKNKGGVFEVYPGPEKNMVMMIVNARLGEDALSTLRPLGSFYCNFVAPGVISIEEEDPHFDGAESRKRHVRAIKQVIDILLKEGHSGNEISFNEIPILKD
jgi:hypothetical protein